MKKSKVVKGVKAFNQDMTCRGFKFELGKTYKTDDAVICQKGFHFCENPLDLFGYYSPTNKFAEVEGTGKIVTHSEDSKVACTEIKIGAEVNLNTVISMGVKFILSKIKWSKVKKANNTGYYSAATNTGNYSAATNTGDRSAATNTGNYSAATNTGYQSAATNTGYYSAATNTGYQSAATNTGYYSAATNTGYQSAATNTGYYSAATNTGYQSAATNTGYYSAATNTGDRSAATNTGDRSAATNTGDRSAATVEGKQSIACGLGIKNKAKGKISCWLVLTEWHQVNNEWQIKDCQARLVDGVKIKEDVWYELKGGEFKEAKGL